MEQPEDNRGAAFELRVKALLESLAANHPGLVKVACQPRLKLHNNEVVIPDFELRYDLGFQEDARLVECQSRRRSSSQIVHKIRHIKSLSGRNRFMFVYENKDFLAEATRSSLEADGISFYSYRELETFTTRLDLALQGITAASRFGRVISEPTMNSVDESSTELSLYFAKVLQESRIESRAGKRDTDPRKGFVALDPLRLPQAE